MINAITPAQITETWKKYAEGKPIKPGFAEWLAAELNRIEPIPPPTLPLWRAEDLYVESIVIGKRLRKMLTDRSPAAIAAMFPVEPI